MRRPLADFCSAVDTKKAIDKRLLAKRKESTHHQGLDPQTVDPMPHWVIHDLRRTAVTGMNELGIAPHVVEAAVNHISGTKGGIAGVYNKAQHLPERRQALTLWAEHVLGLIDRGKSAVIPMRRA